MARGTVIALLRFTGATTRLSGLTVRQGRVYRVFLVSGCGSFQVRIYEPESPAKYAVCPYSNLASFMENWEVVEW